MSTGTIDELIRMWEQVELTADQAIGQLMLHIQELTQRVSTLERSLEPPNRPRQFPETGRPGLL